MRPFKMILITLFLHGKIEEILNWEYAYKLAENIPTKTSVSKIKDERNKQKSSIIPFLRQDEDITKQNAETLKIPNFIKEEQITGAQKGTLIHLCIRNLDETKDYSLKDVEDLVQKLKNKKIITKKEAEAINLNTILQYTKSELFKNLKNAKEVHKEEPFYINLTAREIYNVDVDENILVQGIIDLYYIDKEGKVILVDYKTDFVQKEEELKTKYKEQLELYKRAIEGALNVHVDKVIIYSTYLQKEILI